MKNRNKKLNRSKGMESIDRSIKLAVLIGLLMLVSTGVFGSGGREEEASPVTGNEKETPVQDGDSNFSIFYSTPNAGVKDIT